MQPYHEYTNFMLRQYFARNQNSAPDNVELLNRSACDLILRDLSDKDFQILRDVFENQRDVKLNEAVRKCAENNRVSETKVWNTIRLTSRKIARARGLV